jgi:endonuclease/exonuclease/phosphatase family metal-dependent hydrolase
MKRIKTLLKGIGILLGLFLLYVIIVLVHGTITDYQPEEKLELKADITASEGVIQDSVLSFLIWNVGYGGLGAESDFFYDTGGMLFSGGKSVRPDRDVVEKNVKGAEQFLQQTKADFFLLQEVDRQSKRSYFIDQTDRLEATKPGFASWFALNYNSPRVPLPVFEPWHVYGKTHSGLLTLSKWQATASSRYQLPGDYAWPTRIFQLDRCAAQHRYPLGNGKELVVLNIHNSAYDKGGELKKQQMAFLKEMLLDEYEQGNYVVVGGDWNQCPPYFRADTFMPGQSEGYEPISIPSDFLPENWMWVYDPTVPTNRKVSDPFKAGKTFVTLIDFFLISPNVRVKTVKGLDYQFQFSDHQPVWMEVELL